MRKAFSKFTSSISKLRLREVKDLNHRNTVSGEELGPPDNCSRPLSVTATTRVGQQGCNTPRLTDNRGDIHGG